MKKFISILILVSLLWLLKLSFDFYTLSRQMTTQQHSLQQSEQQNASLNDQLVALQRKEATLSVSPNEKDQLHSTKLSPTLVIQQQLELIQFALQQQQFVYALEKLNALDQSMDDYEIAESLKQSLHQAILQDQQSIQQYVVAHQAQQTRLAQMLQQLDQQIKQDFNSQKLSTAPVENGYFWQKWLKVDVVGETTVNLNSRMMILKEIQLRVLLAQQALFISEYQSYQNMLQGIIQQLDTLPDAFSQHMKQQVVKIEQIHVLPVPKLKAREILG
ncbi:hypothetical protein EC844_101381 [Acinetobacter calcoaceticus]|uniref:Uroporphyrin-3 C-methyltransferase n=1 Tax=Acinetobacter calcoaceticus TaxID=471 RepID=A0A4R1Y1V2_ACICA|nr:hypothetical protein EC844_101381 [Acinetobacter calcoaceticus]